MATTSEVDCTNGDIRLINGSNPLEGRVEICLNRAWGTVCDSGFGQAEADVVCRQLDNQNGYLHDGTEPLRDLEFGEGSGPIFTDNFRCSGEESELVGVLGCPLGNPLGFHMCDHSQDAGVICTGELCNDNLGDKSHVHV